MHEPEMSKTTEMIARIVSAFASRSDVSADDIVALVSKLKAELSDTAPQTNVQTSGAGKSQSVIPSTTKISEKPTPALPIADAVTRDSVYCLCCGKGFKMLKRHLGSEHNLSEDAYRQLFDLPDDMPLVAPSYSERKAAHAMRMGFGKYNRDSSENGSGKPKAKVSSS